ncbi:MAG: NAD-binding protein [Bacteroidales bacterium]|nr:NAD-binding protein [Bacteroidales bacterium]
MNDDNSEQGRQFLIPIILTIIATVLGLISFHLVFPEYTFLRKLYLTFQLFTMESGDHFYANGPQPIPVTVIFNLARYMAVAALVITIVLAIISVLRYKYFVSRVRFMKGHTILCGLGEVGEAMAESFRRKNKLVIIENDTSNENLAGLKKEGAKIIEANALDSTVLGKIGIDNAKSFAAVTGNDFNNLTIINHLLELIKNSDKKEKSNVSLAANIDSRNLKVAITEEWKKERGQPETELKKDLQSLQENAATIKLQGGFGKAKSELTTQFESLAEKLLNYKPEGTDFKSCEGNIKLFNINQLAARYIYRDYPPDRFRGITKTDDPVMNILILGYSKIGEELLKLCIQNCHYVNRKNTRVTLIAHEADQVMKRINSIYSNIHKLIDFRAVNKNPHHLAGKLIVELELLPVDVIYICSADDRYQASYSSRARELFDDNVPVVRPFYLNKTWKTTNSPKNLYSFNILSKVAILEDIISECFDRKAMAVHHRWIKLEIPRYIDDLKDCINNNQELPYPKPTLLPWHQLDEEIRDDNRSVVEHINVKIRSLGELSDPAMYKSPEKAGINYDFLKDADKVEQLAEMEHRRWMATKYLYGWDYGAKRDYFLRLHESLVDFNQLDENTKQYDRNQVQDIEDIINLK